MNSKRKLFIVSAVFAVLCVASAFMAENIDAINQSSNSGWDNLGRAAWITVVVTIPSGVVSLVALVAAIRLSLKKPRR